MLHDYEIESDNSKQLIVTRLLISIIEIIDIKKKGKGLVLYLLCMCKKKF